MRTKKYVLEEGCAGGKRGEGSLYFALSTKDEMEIKW